ncbi:histone deacetylase family protein [Pseudoalteromonas sp. JC3]|uniref:histone deacetylase family protein n=1 Tax=Pseudoalteromonas sp. JC3 TaxID=2810196 RepID=UPI0019D0C4FA|nr:histone deacetylase family protein [Pseudoalteromonas sp. JC3]MBR8845810.1 histone deacetylase family protein [Pseudoalteromonas sp. JC3]WJE08384.1 histone deacetylase family protein [Pseudoalteromonas sp. JC3]
MHTAIITHPYCRKHKMTEEHPECPARLDAISDRLLASGLDIAIEHKTALKADTSHYALVHDQAMIKEVMDKIPNEGLTELDGDTWLCPDSMKAIERAVGAGILAVDEVVTGKLDAAFCSVRPPGHHANQSTSSGFCVFNNVAIAAAYAKTKGVERVAILDIDVHHGNGTQDIFKDDHSVLLCSLFQHPFYPNTAIENHQTLINSPLSAGADGTDLKALVEQQWLPKLQSFKPQLIFISAGFDGHLEDDMGGLKFVEQDYQWFTEQVVEFANSSDCLGIISYLEGGYDLSSLGRSAVTHIKALVGLA